MIGYCPLASGSKGNAIFVASRSKKLLIDAGLSAKALNEKLLQIGSSLSQIDAILITHEHVDHIHGLAVIAKKHQIPVFANSDTAQAILEAHDRPIPFKIFSTGETFTFGDIEIHPFSIQHDTLDPVAFTFNFANIKLGICTDLGFATTLVKSRLAGCDYLYVEANHEPSMVHASSRSEALKARILSRQGHLSNEQCADLIRDVAHPKLRHIYLAHLSAECNHPHHAFSAAEKAVQGCNLSVPISIAHQHQVSRPLIFD